MRPPGSSPGGERPPEDSRFLNRELSWLEFNRRVLATAEDTSLPLLERLRFLAIFSRNLDEFFQVRVALLHAERESRSPASSPDGRSAEQQLAAIRERTLELTALEQEIFRKRLCPALEQAGLRICGWDALAEEDRAILARVFEERIFPVLTPLAVDPAHPFPYVSDLSLNLAVLVRHPESEQVRFARIKVPPLLGRLLPLPDGERFVPIEQVIAVYLERLFPGMVIESHCPFRVTRDADLDIEEEDGESLLLAVESSLRRRSRRSEAVRLEADRSMSQEALDLLLEELDLDPEDVYVRDTLLDLGSLWELCVLDRPDLKLEPWTPCHHPRLLASGEQACGDFFAALDQGDLLVHHPYDSFESSVEAFLAQAAADPDVLAIKHTIYRTSGPENPIVGTLMRAAQSGVQVVTVVELQARFDEETNIEWARALEQAGVHVVYGLVGLKTHAKVILVVRREGDRIRRYCHVGTGNYNRVTARVYEDIGIFSAAPELGADLTDLFNQLTGYSREPSYRKLLVAPEGMRAHLLEWIRQERKSGDGRIVMKVNNLSDPRVIEALYEASAGGVEIDLIVRGICCLRAGVPGLSERIRVRSTIGRFLEHSRIFRFGSPARGARYYIGSADLMPRKLDRRVEVVAPVEDPLLQARLEQVLRLLLADDALAWELRDSAWHRVPRRRGLDSQQALQRLARERSQVG
jgi:polyphosphate kinase